MADPIPPDYHAMMNGLAAGIDDVLNGPKLPGISRKVGFILLVAEFGRIENGRVNYISNGAREDMIAMLREYLARLEGRYQEPAPDGKAC